MGGKSVDPNKAAMKQQNEQMKRLDALQLPDLQEYILQNPELVGLLDTEQLGGSALEEISLDPAARESQLAALQSLQEYSDTGITDTDKYAMEEMLGQVGAATKSNQAAIEADMARKGMDSSGAALMSKMDAQQSGANSARQQAMQQAAQGQQNRMSALNQLASQSGQMQQQDFARQVQIGSAKDAIAQANAANRYQTNAANLGAKQSIENQRANIANQQSQVANQISQQNFNNSATKAGAQGNVANAMSNIAANTPQGPSGLQAGLSGAATGASIGSSMGPVGAGYGAAAGGAVGLLSTMQDGGIASKYADGGLHSNFQDGIDSRKLQAKEKEEKQHDAFKKKYMKKVHDELIGDKYRSDIPRAEDGMFFDKAKMMQDLNTVNSGQRTDNMVALGQGNDKTSADVQTNEQAQKVLKQDNGSGIDYSKALGALSSLMGSGKSAQKEKLNIQNSPIALPDNVMNPVGPQQFANPYENMFADGGCSKSPKYASDGMGDIINSGMDSFAGDRVDAKVNDGEAVLNAPQQQRFMDLVRGKISVDELGDDDIIEGVPRDYRDSLHEKIESEGKESGSSSKIRGLQKLLEILGEE